jgi:hypothetical protein
MLLRIRESVAPPRGGLGVERGHRHSRHSIILPKAPYAFERVQSLAGGGSFGHNFASSAAGPVPRTSRVGNVMEPASFPPC